MTNVKLLDFFVQNNTITAENADKVRVELVKSNLSLEQLLLKMDLVSDSDIAKAKSEIFNIPYVDLTGTTIEESVFSLVSIDKLKKYRAIPFEKAGHIIKVAMSDPFDIQSIQALKTQLNNQGKILVYITTDSALNAVLDRNIGGLISTEVSDALEDVDSQFTEIEESTSDDLDSTNLASAPVARIVNSIFQYAVKTEASDIHIEPQEGKLRIRFRINGVMNEKLVLPFNLRSSVIARIKIMANLKIDEKRIPQDGRIQIKSGDHRIDVRVSTLPSIYGEKIVMRLLDTSEGVPPLEASGLRGGAFQRFVEATSSTNGIILVTGPTGSGKTRTLASTLARINSPTVNIVTLEDPVEIRTPGITQVQINPDIGLTFAAGLRAILRQDPDIVMVGEVRDQETANLAVEASLIGRLVLATLHTNSAAAAIPRLLDMGIEPYLLASTLRLAAAQRLARKICNNCRVFEPASEQLMQNIREVLSVIPNFDPENYLTQLASKNNPEIKVKAPEVTAEGKKVVYIAHGKGCEECEGTGYNGRIGIFEVMPISKEIVELISDNSTINQVEDMAIKQGMLKMIHDGYLKALEGITTVEEVLRVSKE